MLLLAPQSLRRGSQCDARHQQLDWKVALPLHIEYRTMPMLFYVPPLLPVMGKLENGIYEHKSEAFFSTLEKSRLPIKFLAKLFAAGNESHVEAAVRKLMAVRYYRRSVDMDDIDVVEISKVMREGKTTPKEADEIYALTAIPTIDQRFVLPPIQREEVIGGGHCSPEACKGCTGLGTPVAIERGP